MVVDQLKDRDGGPHSAKADIRLLTSTTAITPNGSEAKQQRTLDGSRDMRGPAFRGSLSMAAHLLWSGFNPHLNPHQEGSVGIIRKTGPRFVKTGHWQLNIMPISNRATEEGPRSAKAYRMAVHLQLQQRLLHPQCSADLRRTTTSSTSGIAD